MNLAEKLRALRAQEGLRRGLWRPLTQREVANALRQELGFSLSQAYLSQLEGGKRTHLTNTSREALARFYHVHPGYLVNDLADPPPSASSQAAPSSYSSLPTLRDALAPHGHAMGKSAPSVFSTSHPSAHAPQQPAAHDGWFGWLATGAPVEGLEAMGLLCRLPQRTNHAQGEARSVANTDELPIETPISGDNDGALAAVRLLGVASDRPDLRRVLTLMEALLRLPDDRLRVIEAALGLTTSAGTLTVTADEQAGADTQQAMYAPRRSARED